MKGGPGSSPGLEEIRDQAFRLLAEGVAQPDSPFRTPALATCDEAGAPGIRSVVLRGFDPNRRRLSFHSDVRAAKLEQLRRNPVLALHVWDAGRKLQLRVDGVARISVADGVAKQAWQDTPPRSRRGYHQQPAPGAVLPDPAALHPDALDEAAAFGNFALIEAEMQGLESLLLRREGNLRSLFRWQADAWCGSWLAP